MLQKFEGIILRTIDYGESHQVLGVFTEHLGKIAMMARGSKKTRSRFGAVTEPFTQAHFVSFSGGSGMATLSQADLIQSHHRLRSDLLLTSYGAYWLELVDKCTQEREPIPHLYRFLTTMLHKLEEGVDPDILTRIFELYCLRVAGYQPVLHHCVNCHSTDRPVRFSAIQGGFLCVDCKGMDMQALPVSEAVAHILPILQKLEIQQLGEINLKAETQEQLERVIHAFMREHFPVKLKSQALLQQVKGAWT